MFCFVGDDEETLTAPDTLKFASSGWFPDQTLTLVEALQMTLGLLKFAGHGR